MSELIAGTTALPSNFAGPKSPISDQQKAGNIEKMLNRAESAAEKGNIGRSSNLAAKAGEMAEFESGDESNSTEAAQRYQALYNKALEQLRDNLDTVRGEPSGKDAEGQGQAG